MEEKSKVEYVQYQEPINFFSMIILALLGASAGIGVWVIFAELGFFHPLPPFLIGILAMFGARYKQRKDQIISVIVATLVTIIALILGDFIETLIVRDSSFNLEQYMGILWLKLNDGPEYGIAYLATPFMPAIFEYWLRRAEAQGRF